MTAVLVAIGSVARDQMSHWPKLKTQRVSLALGKVVEFWRSRKAVTWALRSGNDLETGKSRGWKV